MKNFRLLLVAAFAGILSSCSVTMPVTATDNASSGKVGTAKNNCLGQLPRATLVYGQLINVSGGLCFNDDKYSLYDAAMNGGISKIATVDLKHTNYVFFHKYELIVTGE